jgi:hypothetical protein
MGESTRRADETRARATPERPQSARQQGPSRPRWPLPLALLGLLGLALAAILAWGVAPGRKQLPADADTTREFSGTANALLNQQAIDGGNFDDALVTNVPVTGQRRVRVLETNGNAARVQDDRTLMAGGQTIGTTSHTYAVDRRSLEPTTDFPAEWNVEPHQGLTVSFPIGAEQRDYTGWVPDTQSTTPIRFVREESRGGVNTYVYEADAPAAPIRDEAVLDTLPANLSREELQGLAPSLPISPEQRSMLVSALPALPDQVAITYTHESGATYWVEPTTGIVIDTQQQMVRTATIGGPGGSVLATMPVFNVDSRFTDGSVSAAASDANDRRNALNMVGSTWPWVLGTLGLLALLAGLLGLLARRRPQPQPVPPAYRPTERTTAVDTDAARRGQPQPPYVGQTPHTGPYRESHTGQETGSARADEAARRGQPGQGQPGQGQPGPGQPGQGQPGQGQPGPGQPGQGQPGQGQAGQPLPPGRLQPPPHG